MFSWKKNKNIHSFETIVAYHTNQLSKSDEALIDQLMREDDEFAKEVDSVYRELLINPDLEMDIKIFKHKLFRSLTNVSEKKTSYVFRSEALPKGIISLLEKPGLMYATFILLLIASVFLGREVFFSAQMAGSVPCSIEDVYCWISQHPYDARITQLRSGHTSKNRQGVDSLLQRGYYYFTLENYQAAIPELQQYLGSAKDKLNWQKPKVREATLMLAISYLANQDVQNALSQLTIVHKMADIEPRLLTEYQWYAGLSHLYFGDAEKSRDLLHASANSRSRYQFSAQTLLHALKHQ